jgi:hypothetical protein
VAADRAFADGAKAKGFLAFRSVICRENRSRKTMGYLQKNHDRRETLWAILQKL